MTPYTNIFVEFATFYEIIMNNLVENYKK